MTMGEKLPYACGGIAVAVIAAIVTAFCIRADKRKAELRRRETTLRLRVIELESRLKTFRDEFKSLQSKAVSQN